MAIEVTFGVRGKETTQALYIQDSDWEISLTRLRKIIEEQSLYVPLEYKFLSLKDNAISHPAEESIVLKEIIHYSSIDEKYGVQPKSEDFGMTSEIAENICKKQSAPTIWITPLKVNFSSGSPNPETTANAATTAEEEGPSPSPQESGGSQLGDDDPLLRSETNANGQQAPGRNCSGCPYTIFMDFVHGQKGPPSTKTVLKILLLLAFILFMLLGTLTLTLHVMVASFTNIGRSPALMDLFSKFDSGRDDSSELVSELQNKLSQLELSTKYEIHQLNARLVELEDLYLHDLALHKKELNLIKKQMAHDSAHMYSEEDDDADFEESSHTFERSAKKPKRKPGSDKINERTKG